MKNKFDIIMYGAPWCGDCKRSKRLLEEKNIPFTYKDVEADPAADKELRELIGTGNRSLPRILFRIGADETSMRIEQTLIEPSDQDLLRELRIRNWITPRIKKHLAL